MFLNLVNVKHVRWHFGKAGGSAQQMLRVTEHLEDSGAVVTWGMDQFGGDSSGVANEISSRVVTVCGTAMAFAALTSTGRVVLWGMPRFGGQSPPELAHELSEGVVALQSNGTAFVALKDCCGPFFNNR